MPVPQRGRVRDWLHELGATARRAAQRALLSKTAARNVQIGASGTPSAQFDVETERAIVRELDHAPIPLNLVSEEVGNIGRRGAEWTLVVDPVDGSRNASRGIPFYCVSLAIARKGLSGVEMGLVQNIPSGEVYWAERGRGATREGRKIRTRRLNPEELVVGAALDYERGLKIPGGDHVHFRDFGSAALEMCLVADGRLDAFICIKPYLRIVDVAASALVLREAGGHVWDLKRKPLNVPFVVSNRFSMVAAGDAQAWRYLR